MPLYRFSILDKFNRVIAAECSDRADDDAARAHAEVLNARAKEHRATWSPADWRRRGDKAVADARELCEQARLVHETTVQTCRHTINLVSTFLNEPERLRGPQHDAAWCDEVALLAVSRGLGHADVRAALGY